MKVLKPGREQTGWAREAECTGHGNGGGGCGALLLVERDDVYETSQTCRTIRGCHSGRGRSTAMSDRFKECIETGCGFVQVQGLPVAVRIDVGDDTRCEFQWLTIEEAEAVYVALGKSIEAARG